MKLNLAQSLTAAAIGALLCSCGLGTADAESNKTGAPAQPPPVVQTAASAPSGSASSSTTITYNGTTYDCQTAFDLQAPCNNSEQNFFDTSASSLPAFVNSTFNNDLPTSLTFEDLAFAAMKSCTVQPFDAYVTELATNGGGNYDELKTTRMQEFYKDAIYVFCDVDEVRENNS